MKDYNADKLPELNVSIEIPPSLSYLVDSKGWFYEPLRQQLTKGLVSLLETLGIPGDPKFVITASDGDGFVPARFLRVTVNGEICRYPDELLPRIYAYVNAAHADPRKRPSRILNWLKQTPEISAERQAVLIDFFTNGCLEIIKRRPSVLLGQTQLSFYLESLYSQNDEADLNLYSMRPETNWALSVLRRVLDLKISIADKRLVAKWIVDGVTKEKLPEEVAEKLIAAMRQDVIEIQVPEDYLRKVTSTNQSSDYKEFASIREDLFNELGVTYPIFRFVRTEDVRAYCFRFKINHLTTLPRVGLSESQFVVEDGPANSNSLNIDGRIFLGGDNYSIVGPIDRAKATAAGLTTWNQIGYIALTLYACLKANSECFINTEFVVSQLANLSVEFPTLVETCKAMIPVERLTPAIRRLVDEGISIRNLKSIVERVLDYNHFMIDSPNVALLNDAVPVCRRAAYPEAPDDESIAAFIRMGMSLYIDQRYFKVPSRVRTIQVDPQIESLICKHQYLDDETSGYEQTDRETRERILEVLHSLLDHQRSENIVAVLLCSTNVRSAIRTIVAQEFPRLPVLSYDEIPGNLSLDQTDKISPAARALNA